MNLSKNEIESQLLAITRTFLHELQAERALQAITLDASLERELGIDSLGKVELFNRIEKTFAIQLSETAMVEAESLNDLVHLIKDANPAMPVQMQTQHFATALETISIDLSSVKTLLEVIHTYATRQPKRPHIYLQDENGIEQIIRYEQLFEESMRVAKGLCKHGIKPGETVAIMLPTSDSFFYAFCGTLLAGAIPIPIYPPFRPDRILEYAKREARILQNAQVRVLITFSSAEILSNMLKPFIPSLKEVTTLKNLQTSTGSVPDLSIDTDDLALIQYSSGSTGDPKGIALAHKNILANIRALGKGLSIKPTDVVVSWLPLYHDMGLMTWMASLYYGIPVIILSPITFLARPERWLWAIHYHRGTLSGGPNFAYELCVKRINPQEIEGLDLSSWRFAFNGAEAVNPKTLSRFYKKFASHGFKKNTFAPVYGLAESTVGLTAPREPREPYIDKIKHDVFATENKAIPTTDEKNSIEFAVCGEPLPDHEIRIVDDQGVPLPERMVGNMQFRGPSSMQGYYNNPEATQKTFDHGWWNSGDLGYLIGKEFVITGRKKDLIIKAGRNLYPEEVEEIVSQVAGVRHGCIIAFGVHDPATGTEKLIVVAESYEQDHDRQQHIRTEIIEKMAVELGIPPDTVLLVPPKTIPKTSSGKLQRSACKQDFIEGKLSKYRMPVKLQIAKLAIISLAKKIKSWIGYLGKFFYSIYIGMILLFIMPLLYLVILPMSQQRATKIARAFARLICRLACCPIKITGAENLKKHAPMIYAVNHTSYIDALVLFAILPQGVNFVAKQELLNAFLLGKIIKKLNLMTVDRLDLTKSLKNKKQIEELIRQGQSFVIFPEGTFTYATGLRPFKLGAFSIAVETVTPICPIALRGTRSILRGESLLMKPGTIDITITNPIYPEGNDWDEIMRLHTLTRAELAKHCGESVIDIIAAGPVST